MHHNARSQASNRPWVMSVPGAIKRFFQHASHTAPRECGTCKSQMTLIRDSPAFISTALVMWHQEWVCEDCSGIETSCVTQAWPDD